MKPIIITKITGHVAGVARASDLRYLDETASRGNWHFTPLSRKEVRAHIGKVRRIFPADPDGK